MLSNLLNAKQFCEPILSQFLAILSQFWQFWAKNLLSTVQRACLALSKVRGQNAKQIGRGQLVFFFLLHVFSFFYFFAFLLFAHFLDLEFPWQLFPVSLTTVSFFQLISCLSRCLFLFPLPLFWHCNSHQNIRETIRRTFYVPSLFATGVRLYTRNSNRPHLKSSTIQTKLQKCFLHSQCWKIEKMHNLMESIWKHLFELSKDHCSREKKNLCFQLSFGIDLRPSSKKLQILLSGQ